MEWLIPLLTLAAAAGGVKVMLNGSREDIREIKRDVKDGFKGVNEVLTNHEGRLSRAEAKIEDLR